MKKLIPVALSMTLLLSGCFKKEEPIPEPPPTDKTISILDLKTKYGEQDNKHIMPLYNVKPDERFEFSFKSYLGDLSVHDVITVHTDSTASDSSIIDTDITPESFNIGPTTLRVSPKESILTLQNSKTWGKAPIYYIKINYDMDTDKPTKLTSPIIIPFTVKNEVQAPQVNITYNEKGLVKLTWGKVEGATSYKIYNLTKQTLSNNGLEKVTSIKQAFKGYTLYNIGEVKETEFSDWSSDGTKGIQKTPTGETVWLNKGLNGDYFVTAVINKQESNASNIVSSTTLMNNVPTIVEEDINGTKHETTNSLPKTVKVSMLDGRKADLPVTYLTEGVAIEEGKPTTIKYTIATTPFTGVVSIEKTTETDLLNLYNATKQPEEVPTITLTNKTKYTPPKDLPTVYEPVIVVEETTTEETETDKETKVDDSTVVEEQKTNTTPKEETTTNENATTEAVNNEKQEEPAKEDEVKEPTKEEKELEELRKRNIVTQQKYHTEKEVKQAEQETVTEPAYFEVENFKLNTDTALEEYVALSLLNHKEVISLKAFPSYQGYESLTDAIQKLIYQNPILLDIIAWEYDYTTRAVNVTYSGQNQDKHELIKQAKIILNGKFEEREVTSKNGKKTTTEIVEVEKGIISKDMSVEDKQLAIYNYLVDNISYGVGEEPKETEETKPTDAETTEIKEGNETQSDVTTEETPEQPINLVTAYDVLLNNTGTPESVAKAFKLLSDLAGIESIVLTGLVESKPHTWNKVKYDNQWLNVDVTKNVVTTGVPFMVYNMSDEDTLQVNRTTDNKFYYDNDLKNFTSNSPSRDYYFVNKLIVNNVDEYYTKLSEKLQQGETYIVIRTTIKLDSQTIYDFTGKAIQQFAPDKLATSQFGERGNYIIISTELPQEEEQVNTN